MLQADAFHAGLLEQCEEAEIAGLCLPLERVGDGDASGLPVLLADMVVDRYQLYESRAAGADGVVLIVAAFDDEGEALSELYGEAADIGLDVLLEVGHEDEIEWSMEQLDPDSFVIRNSDGDGGADLERTFSLLEEVPAGIVVVSAGGVRDREEVRALERSGVDARDPRPLGDRRGRGGTWCGCSAATPASRRRPTPRRTAPPAPTSARRRRRPSARR